MGVIPYPRGRPPPDRRRDILYRIASKYLKKKAANPGGLIPLWVEKLESEIGTTRKTISLVFKQFGGVDLGEVLDFRFHGMKLFMAPTSWVLDDDTGELLMHRFDGELMGLCPRCGTWTWLPWPVPPTITCSGCEEVYARAKAERKRVDKVACTQCGYLIPVDSDLVGSEVSCPKCDSIFEVVDTEPCTECGYPIPVDSDLVGSEVSCPNCGSIFEVVLW